MVPGSIARVLLLANRERESFPLPLTCVVSRHVVFLGPRLGVVRRQWRTVIGDEQPGFEEKHCTRVRPR